MHWWPSPWETASFGDAAMSLLQICLATAATLQRKLAHPRMTVGGQSKPVPVRAGAAPAARDGVLGSDPYGLWALNEFLSSGSLSHR